MTAERNPATGARTRAFRGPRRAPQVDTTVRQDARARLLSLDEYTGVPKGRKGTYSTPGRGVNGESSN